MLAALMSAMDGKLTLARPMGQALQSPLAGCFRGPFHQIVCSLLGSFRSYPDIDCIRAIENDFSILRSDLCGLVVKLVLVHTVSAPARTEGSSWQWCQLWVESGR